MTVSKRNRSDFHLRFTRTWSSWWGPPKIPVFQLDPGAASYALSVFHPLVAAAAPAVLKHVGPQEEWIPIAAWVMISIIVSKIAFSVAERLGRAAYGGALADARGRRCVG
jgi:hypothetical protein